MCGSRFLQRLSWAGKVGGYTTRYLRVLSLLGVVAVCGLVTGAGAFAQTPGIYRINPERSRIEIHVYRTGFLAGFGDNHLIAAKRFSGTAEGKGGNSWTIQVVVEADSLEVTDPGASAATRGEVQETMLGPEQLDVTRFPQIVLQSRSLELGTAQGTWRMFATVALHGVTREVEFPLEWKQNGDELRVRGKKYFRLRDFHIEPIRRAFGAVRVKNEFEVTYDIVLDRECQSGLKHKIR